MGRGPGRRLRFVFVNLFHAPLGEPMRYPIAHQLLAGLSAKSGLDRTVTPHMFRHGTGQALAGGGVDIAVIKELLHHASFTSTEIYTRPSTFRPVGFVISIVRADQALLLGMRVLDRGGGVRVARLGCYALVSIRLLYLALLSSGVQWIIHSA